MSGRTPKKSDNSKYYDVLGVSKNVSQEDLRKAYKTAAMKNHPDKGGDPEKFKELVQANEVLRDPEKRKMYDLYGEDAPKEGMGGGAGGHDPFDNGSSFCGGSPFFGGGGSSRGQKRGEDVVIALEVSLEDLYIGIWKNFHLSRNVFCSKCNGKCPGCQGSGVKVSSWQGYSMYPCNECKGTGESNDKDTCTVCKGEKVVTEKKVLKIHVEKGMQNAQKITFPGEADEAPDTVTGDIVFVLEQTDHPKYKRVGDDLFVEHTLSYNDAHYGVQFIITRLDGSRRSILSQPGQVKDGQWKQINDEGMPIHQRPSTKGKLFIHFTVDPEQCEAPEAVESDMESAMEIDVESDEPEGMEW